MRNLSVPMLAVALGLLPHPAQAGDIVFFHTPSNNIHCAGFTDENGPAVDCEVLEITRSTAPQKRPADCDLEWGHRFSLNEHGLPSMGCTGDTVRDPNGKVLDYGQAFAVGTITCSASEKGLNCENPEGHGFFVSKSRQTFY